MKTICVLTATRAEFGLLLPVIKRLNDIESLKVEIVATGAHLSPEFGMTIREIESEGIVVNKRIEILLAGDTSTSISKTMGIAMISFADYFSSLHPDALLVLGDRYETLAVCCVAMNERIPIFHMCGGETTEGAIDEAVRHSITKMSWVHFTTTEKYRSRVIQLGEDPSRVFCVGSTGVENVKNIKMLSKEELEKELGFSLGKSYAVATFHPVTLEERTEIKQIREILQVVASYHNINFLFTKANADVGGHKINEILCAASSQLKNLKLVDSLGTQKYMSAVKNALFVMGNSSSGISEVPALGVPTVNIGDRQKGRVMPKSVICCETDKKSIIKAINLVMSNEFRRNIDISDNPYDEGEASLKVATIIKKFMRKRIEIKKSFYDII